MALAAFIVLAGIFRRRQEGGSDNHPARDIHAAPTAAPIPKQAATAPATPPPSAPPPTACGPGTVDINYVSIGTFAILLATGIV